MTSDEIKQIVASGEGYNAEFKVTVPQKVKDLSEEICAFANASGGVLLIGVDDANVIRGVEIDNAKRSSIQNSIGEISPKVRCSLDIINVDGKNVGVLEVISGPNKPYVLSGAIFVRTGSNTQKLTTAEEMRDFFQQSNRIYFDDMPCHEFDVVQHVEAENMREFRLLSGISDTVSDEQVLKNLKLFTQEGDFKSGAVLFFGKNPEQFYDSAVIRCIAFDGIDKRYIADDKTMTGPLYIQHQKTMEWLKGKLNIRYDIEGSGSGPRREIWEIPETALKEAVVNTLSHRDYYDRGSRINIELFDNRIDISNPGGLVSAIPPAEFGKRSYSRNPLIFGLFERMRMVEQVGSGITRIRDLMNEAGLPEPAFSFEGIFSVTFLRPVDFIAWIEKWSRILTDNRIRILKEIHSNSRITKKELGELLGISSTAIDKNINSLRKNKLVERKGGDKSGEWIIRYNLPQGG